MPQPKHPASSRYGLVAAAAIVLALCFAILAGVASANTVQIHRGPLPPSVSEPRAEEEIWEEEGWEEENSEEGDAEEAEEAEEEEYEEPEPTQAECKLYAATARLVASDRHDSVRLTVRYETSEATTARVEYWLNGARGSFQLKPLKRHMFTRGTIVGSERLSAREMAKVRAARIFVVHLEMPGLAPGCERYCTRHLTARRDSGAQTIWSEPAPGTEPTQ